MFPTVKEKRRRRRIIEHEREAACSRGSGGRDIIYKRALTG